jgi:hypothetical protein
VRQRSISWDHVCAVLDFDRAHGVFRIPFDQFVTFFTFLAIEEG